MNEQAQDAMDQAQAEQGLAQQWDDDIMLKAILEQIRVGNCLGMASFKYLCGALKIDARDVT